MRRRNDQLDLREHEQKGVDDMDFMKWLVQDVLSDNITWITVAGILFCWTLGVADIVKHGWTPKEEAE